MNNSTQHQQLNRLVGRWNTTGRVLATATTPEMMISGTDTYEWLPGEFFLLHKVDVLVGDEKNETLEIIGADTAAGDYFMQYYTNRGESGSMKASSTNDEWHFIGERLRFTGHLKKDGNEFSGKWEQSSDGSAWTHFMDIILTKA